MKRQHFIIVVQVGSLVFGVKLHWQWLRVEMCESVKEIEMKGM